MNLTSQQRIIRASRAAYFGLLFLYPRALRRKFGAEMADAFEDLLREAMVRQGTGGAAAIWRSALWELIIAAAPAHLASPPLMAGALSFLASSVLFLAILSTVN